MHRIGQRTEFHTRAVLMLSTTKAPNPFNKGFKNRNNATKASKLPALKVTEQGLGRRNMQPFYPFASNHCSVADTAATCAFEANYFSPFVSLAPALATAFTCPFYRSKPCAATGNGASARKALHARWADFKGNAFAAVIAASNRRKRSSRSRYSPNAVQK